MSVTTETISASIRDAFDLARRGQLQHAEVLCSEVLRQQSDHPDALLLRSVIEVQTGRMADGAASIRQLLRIDPTRPQVHALLGDALLNLKEPAAALDSYDAALALAPDLANAHHGRGNALLDMQRPADAVVSYDQVLAINPDDAETLFNRGNALLRLADLDAAVASFDRAVKLRPRYATALNNRGSALLMLKRLESALASFDAAIESDPAFSGAWHNRGCVLREMRRLPEALEAFERTLAIRPDHADALCSRGITLLELKRPEDALASFDAALLARPGLADARRGRGDALLELGRAEEALAAHDEAARSGLDPLGAELSRGNSLRALRRFPEAVDSYDAAIRRDPGNARAHFGRGTAFLQWDEQLEEALASFARALQLSPGEFDYAAGALYYTQRNRADWSVRSRSATAEGITEAIIEGRRAAVPFHFLAISDSAAAQLACARSFVADRCRTVPQPLEARRHRHERIRIAYVSADLREHAVSYLMAGVFERHDPRRFETTAISLTPEEDSPTGQRVKNAFTRFIDASGKSDREVADLMRELEIDIAVDLGGFTDGLRPQIFEHRAAPVQVNYLGFPGTLGAPFVDYIIADDYVIPPTAHKHYAERVVYLPDCFQANDDLRPVGVRRFERAELGLPTAGFVFCAMNNTYKITPQMFDVWTRLLDRVSGSVLWLLGQHAAVADNLRTEAAGRGINPARLIFAGRIPYADHLSRLNAADLFLDTLPFNAGATASDALWAGLPLLTCSGEAYAARMAGSLLRALGLPELITTDLLQYEARAVELASKPEELAVLRRRLADSRVTSPLYDTDRFTRHLESAYQQMWQRHQSGDAPAAFAVTLV